MGSTACASSHAIGAPDPHLHSVRLFAPAIKRIQGKVFQAMELVRRPASDLSRWTPPSSWSQTPPWEILRYGPPMLYQFPMMVSDYVPGPFLCIRKGIDT